MESVSVTVHRGEHGYGFSVIESCPVKVGRVDRGQYLDHNSTYYVLKAENLQDDFTTIINISYLKWKIC